MNYAQWDTEKFRQLPYLDDILNEKAQEIEALIILPEEHNHESGYRCMSFVVIQNNIPTYRINGNSDVIHLGGIGGWNFSGMQNSKQGFLRMSSKVVPNAEWQIDCLPKSGLLRLYSMKYLLKAGRNLSSFELFYHE